MARINPTLFHFKFQCFKNIHFGRLVDISRGLEPPLGTIIHDVNDFEDTTDIAPSIEDLDWFWDHDGMYQMLHNNLLNPRLFVNYNTNTDTQIKHLNVGILNDLSKYSAKNVKRVKITKNADMFQTRSNIIDVMNHRALMHMRMTGMMKAYRRMNFILFCMFDRMVQCPDNFHHILPFKLGDKDYSKVDFSRIFKNGFTTVTVGDETDLTFLFLANLLCYILQPEHATPFHQLIYWDDLKKHTIDEKERAKRLDLAERFHIMFHNDAHAAIYSLHDIATLLTNDDNNLIKFLKQLNLITGNEIADEGVNEIVDPAVANNDPTIIVNDEAPEVVRDTSIPTPIDTDKVEALETKRSQEIQHKGGLFQPVGGSVHGISPNASLPEEIINDKKDEQRGFVSPKPPKPVNIYPGYQGRAEHTAKELAIEHFIDKAVNDRIEKVGKNYTKAQKERLIAKANAYKQITIDGKRLPEILDSANGLMAIEHKDLSHLSDQVADQGYLKSAPVVIDEQYHTKLLERDTLMAMVSMNRNGRFLTDLKREVVQNKMEDYVVYTATYESETFAKSTFKVEIPTVRQDGTLISRGQVKKIFKQRINRPICKTGPHRVALYSNYNKSLVQLTGPARSTFLGRLNDLLIKKNDKKIRFKQGRLSDPKNIYPLELTLVASQYQWIELEGIVLRFRLTDVPYNEQTGQWRLNPDRSKTSVLIDMNNVISIYDGSKLIKQTTFLGWISEVLAVPEPPVLQWTELGIINKDIPIGMIFAYRFGLEETLKMMDVDYDIYETGTRAIPKDPNLVKVKLNDVTIVFQKNPLSKSLILNGLNKFDLSKHTLMDLNDKEAYFQIFTDHKITQSYLAEIDNFFEFFIDPETYEALVYLREPTTVEGVLMRSTELLTTMNHLQPASVQHHRTRCHAKIPAILYNELSKQLASSNRSNRGQKFSINPQAVTQRILQDALTENADINNPIGAIKDMTTFCYTGFGGRSAESFVLRDRIYPDDGAGVISEATVDSSNVALRAQYSMNANIVNLRGFEEPVELDKVDTAGLLSITGCLYPGLHTADQSVPPMSDCG